MILRDATPADFPAILTLNAASVALLSPLDATRLATLDAAACYHRVASDNGEVQAFLLALREGQDYDSPNYRWFASRYPHFLYIDRIVVAGRARGAGIGRRLYSDLFAFAAASAFPLIACEFDIDPPNPVSERFHTSFGFREVGQQVVSGGTKKVSLQAALPDQAVRSMP